MMRRELANRETREMIKLIAISMLAIILYLCLSFGDAYGYQISNLDRLKIDNVAKINWNSDAWLDGGPSPVMAASSSTFNDFNYDFNDPETAYDKESDGNEVCPPVPEPTIIILFGMGAGMLALYRKLK